MIEDAAAQGPRSPLASCFPPPCLRRGPSPVPPAVSGAGTWKSLTDISPVTGISPLLVPTPKSTYDSWASGLGLKVGNCILLFTPPRCPVRLLFPSFTNGVNEAGKLRRLGKSQSGGVLTGKGRKLEEEINIALTPRVCPWLCIHFGPSLLLNWWLCYSPHLTDEETNLGK